MEKNNITLSDVERNKELFEYEMTDVILQLKGEFAKISGKDLKLDEAQFDVPAMNFRQNIPDLGIAPVKLEVNETAASVSGEKFAIPDVSVQNTEIDCPTVPVPVMAVPAAVQVAKPELDCVAADKINSYSAADVKLELPSVSTDVPELSVMSEQISINAPKAASEAKIEKIQIDMPHLQAAIDFSPIEIGVSSITIDKDEIMTSKAYSPISVETAKNSVDSVKIPEKFEYNAQEFTLNKADVQTPDIPKMSGYSAVTITEHKQAVATPSVTAIKTNAPAAVVLEPLALSSDGVNTPTMKPLPMKEANVTIKMPEINFDYPTAALAEFSTVSVEKPAVFTVPEMPDFSAEIQEIIDTAV